MYDLEKSFSHVKKLLYIEVGNGARTCQHQNFKLNFKNIFLCVLLVIQCLKVSENGENFCRYGLLCGCWTSVMTVKRWSY